MSADGSGKRALGGTGNQLSQAGEQALERGVRRDAKVGAIVVIDDTFGELSDEHREILRDAAAKTLSHALRNTRETPATSGSAPSDFPEGVTQAICPAPDRNGICCQRAKQTTAGLNCPILRRCSSEYALG